MVLDVKGGTLKTFLNPSQPGKNHFNMLKSKNISNDQELIQSDPTSCPQNQKGNN